MKYLEFKSNDLITFTTHTNYNVEINSYLLFEWVFVEFLVLLRIEIARMQRKWLNDKHCQPHLQQLRMKFKCCWQNSRFYFWTLDNLLQLGAQTQHERRRHTCPLHTHKTRYFRIQSGISWASIFRIKSLKMVEIPFITIVKCLHKWTFVGSFENICTRAVYWHFFRAVSSFQLMLMTQLFRSDLSKASNVLYSISALLVHCFTTK